MPELHVLIAILVIIVIGAICFWLIDWAKLDNRLGWLLKLLVILICLAAAINRLGIWLL